MEKFGQAHLDAQAARFAGPPADDPTKRASAYPGQSAGHPMADMILEKTDPGAPIRKVGAFLMGVLAGATVVVAIEALALALAVLVFA